jgi:CheY-like chemotaxis protein
MNKSILLVDDTETILLFEQMMLKRTGYQLRTAKSGTLALAEVAKGAPDLILLDIMMPDLDGIETCRRLKENPETAHIPIVMVTTKGEQPMVDRAFEAGCNDFITKPLDLTELMAKVRAYLT